HFLGDGAPLHREVRLRTRERFVTAGLLQGDISSRVASVSTCDGAERKGIDPDVATRLTHALAPIPERDRDRAGFLAWLNENGNFALERVGLDRDDVARDDAEPLREGGSDRSEVAPRDFRHRIG